MPADKAADHPTPSPQTIRTRAFRWYLTGTLLVGVAAGLFAGMSASPVVAVLLPLLFGLLGGAAGLYLAAIDLSKPASQEKLRLLGIVITTLMLALIPSAIYGVLVRTGASLVSLMPGTTRATQEIDVSPGTDPVQPLELVLLRKRLQLLGASDAEQQKIIALAQATSGRAATREGLIALFRRLAVDAKQARDLFADDLITETRDDRQRDAADNLFAFIRRIGGQYEFNANYLSNGATVPISSVQKRLSDDRDALGRLVHDSAGANWLLNHEELRNAVWKLEAKLAEEADAAGTSWMSDSRFANALNQFLTTGAGTSERTSSPDPIARPAIAR